MPAVSVLMPVFNGAEHVVLAVQSILGQTFSDFEFLIIDDGSSDQSFELIRAFADSRINLSRNQQNKGLIYTLNDGIRRAKGKYLVRMDCDDISRVDRLQKQIAFLEGNPQISVVASFFRTIGTSGSLVRGPVRSADIMAHALFENPIAHPSVAMRREVLETCKYGERFVHAEDYALWTQLMLAGHKFQVIPEPLLEYRLHPTQVSSKFNHGQISAADRVRAIWLGSLGLGCDESRLIMHRQIGRADYGSIGSGLDSVLGHLQLLETANEEKRVFDHSWLRRILAAKTIEAIGFYGGVRGYGQNVSCLVHALSANPRLLIGRKFIGSWLKELFHG